jgi:hypothetical protein
MPAAGAGMDGPAFEYLRIGRDVTEGDYDETEARVEKRGEMGG